MLHELYKRINFNFSERNLIMSNKTVKGYEIKPNSDLSGATLTGADLRCVDLSDANLTQVNLWGADLRGANLSGASLIGADLSGADLSGADLSGAYLNDADLSDAELGLANLRGTNLKYANLLCANLRFAELNGAILSDVNLNGADLSGADLSGADLSGAYLNGANLSEANLSDANLNGASLSEAILSGADLSNAILSGANLRHIKSGNNKEIKTMQLGVYQIVIAGNIMAVGCEQHSIDQWLQFTDEQIKAMDTNGEKALNFYHKTLKPFIQFYKKQNKGNMDNKLQDAVLETIITLNNYTAMQAEIIEQKNKLISQLATELENISIMLPEESQIRIENLISKIPF
jgi:uncharacterized protein YjbI with pentapeptide repeats